MNRLRLAFVTRRFWPLVGEAEQATAELAAGLQQRGHVCTIVTPRYGKHWPTDLCIRELPVIRLPHPAPHRWGAMRFQFALSHWLQRKRGELDAVLVDGFDDEALTALGALRQSSVPVIVRVSSDDASTGGGAFGERLKRRWRGLAAFAATSPAAADLLVRGGAPREQITVVPPGVELEPTCSPQRRAAARQSLGETNHDLATATDSPVALCISPFVKTAHLDALVKAWRPLQTSRPDARLWIVGDGPQRDALFGMVSDYGLKYRVVLPGTFDDWCDLYAAADLVIQPAPQRELGFASLGAMAAGLPLVVCAEPHERALAEQHQQTLLVAPAGDVQALMVVVERLLDQPAAGIALGTAARHWIAENRPFARMLDAYEGLLAARCASRSGVG